MQVVPQMTGAHRSCWAALGRWPLARSCGRGDGGFVDDSRTIELLRVLGDPVRWAVVSRLRHGSCCACDLAELAGVSPSLLSHHMGVLRDAGVVTAQRQGRWVRYTLVDGVLDRLGSIVAGGVVGVMGSSSEFELGRRAVRGGHQVLALAGS